MTNRFPLTIYGFPILFLAIVFLAIPQVVAAQTYAIRNVEIVNGVGETIPRGNILIQDGRIAAIGEDISIPRRTETIDGRGLTAYPGMIDPHTSVGLREIGSVAATLDTSEIGDMNPHMLASGAISPHSEHIPVTRVNGVTTVMSAPQGGLFSGQGAIINLNGWVTEEMLVRDGAAMIINFPSELNFSADTPQQQRRRREDAREEELELLRTTLREARSFAKLIDAGVDASENFIQRALVPVVKGEMAAVFTVQTNQEVRDALEIAEEFGLKTVLSGCTQARDSIDLIKESGASVFLGPITDLPDNDADPYDAVFSIAGKMAEAGIRFAFTTRDSAQARDLPFLAGMAVAFGLSRDEALKAITINPAQILGLGDQLGSLEEGKVANIILTEGDPLEVTTNVRHLFIAGEPVDLNSKHTDLYEKFSNRPGPRQ